MKVLTALIIVIMCLSSVYSQKSKLDLNSRIGIVERKENELVCMSIKSNASIAKDSSVNIVFTRKPQDTIKAVVVEKLSASCSRTYQSEDRFSFYSLKVEGDVSGLGNSEDMRLVGIAVVGLTKSIKIKNGSARVDIDGDGNEEYFRQCSSNEGMHYSIWKGVPLKGKRVWKQYFYLGYDVEPDCNEKDYKD